MKKKTAPQHLYIVFGVMIALLLAMIGYFVYLLVMPADTEEPSTNTNTNTAPVKTKKKKPVNDNTNETTSVEVTEPTETTAAGLVEPKPDADTAEDTADDTEVVADAGEQVVTLYFPKTNSACGDVFPVERAITPEEDLYGQIILADMAGPTAEETGYDSAIPAGLGLRRVEYTSAGPIIYVNEAFNEADECTQQTVTAQLVETANAMFDFTAGTEGEVIVGHPEDTTETDTEEDTE